MAQREHSAPGPLLWSPCENGLVLTLREALDVPLADGPGERGTARGTPAISPAKLHGTRLAALVAVLELIFCWCEGTVAFAAAGGALLWVAGKAGPRLGACSPERPLVEVAACAFQRDWTVVAASLGAVTLTGGVLCWRYAAFFDTHPRALARALAPRGALSPTAKATLAIMFGGLGMQLLLQYWLGRALFAVDNFLEDDSPGGLGVSGQAGAGAGFGVSAKRAVELVLIAPVREELLFRGIALHVLRNRVRGDTAVLISGLWFGLCHLANASVARYHPSYVLVQVVLASLFGSFLSSRMLLRGKATGLLEPLVLHISNNIFSAPLPVSTALDFSDPFILLSFAQTVGVYLALLLRDLRALRRIDAER